jgi:hypothetical protein
MLPLVACVCCCSRNGADGEQPPTRLPALDDYRDWRHVLQTYVNDDGLVDYRGLKNNRERLDRFVQALDELDSGTYRAWSTERKVAFWINAYNALTLRIIIDHYPIEGGLFAGVVHPANSIRQIDGAFDGITHRVMGREMTLDEIEHQTLRRDFTEPRIHLALVCAALSCPELRQEPYRGDQLERQFDDQARTFVGDPDNVRIDHEEKVVHLSAIFDWFGGDFKQGYTPASGFDAYTDKHAAVLNYLSGFLGVRTRERLAEGDYKVAFIDYDWTLNDW